MKTLRQLCAGPIATLVITLGWFAAFAPAQAIANDDFRIESKVYSDKGETPASESVALFYDGKVYDYLSSPQEVIVFDFQNGDVTLLDPARTIRTELKIDRLANFSEQLRVRGSRQTDPLLKFAAQPNFEVTHEAAGWLKFTSPQMTYRVLAVKSDSLEMVKMYKQFSDASARLNAMLHPGALPPFPRLSVNDTVEREGKLPTQVEVTISSQKSPGQQPEFLHSQHSWSQKLLVSDRERLDQTKRDLKAFSAVSLDEYLRPVQQARR